METDREKIKRLEEENDDLRDICSELEDFLDVVYDDWRDENSTTRDIAKRMRKLRGWD